MKTNEKILKLLEDKVDDIFLEMQNELDINNGDISPLDAFELDNYIKQLADKIEVVLNNQK